MTTASIVPARTTGARRIGGHGCTLYWPCTRPSTRKRPSSSVTTVPPAREWMSRPMPRTSSRKPTCGLPSSSTTRPAIDSSPGDAERLVSRSSTSLTSAPSARSTSVWPRPLIPPGPPCEIVRRPGMSRSSTNLPSASVVADVALGSQRTDVRGTGFPSRLTTRPRTEPARGTRMVEPTAPPWPRRASWGAKPGASMRTLGYWIFGRPSNAKRPSASVQAGSDRVKELRPTWYDRRTVAPAMGALAASTRRPAMASPRARTSRTPSTTSGMSRAMRCPCGPSPCQYEARRCAAVFART